MMHQTNVTRKVGREDMGSSGRRFFLADGGPQNRPKRANQRQWKEMLVLHRKRMEGTEPSRI